MAREKQTYNPAPPEFFDESVLRLACEQLAYLGEAVYRAEIVVTSLLRLSDHLSCDLARKIGPKAGVSAVRMDDLILVARSDANAWFHWIEGSHSLDSWLRWYREKYPILPED